MKKNRDGSRHRRDGLYRLAHLRCAFAGGIPVVILDNLSNSKRGVAGAVGDIAGTAPVFYEGDLRTARFWSGIFRKRYFFAVIHFAGMKAVGRVSASLWPIMKITSPAPSGF